MNTGVPGIHFTSRFVDSCPRQTVLNICGINKLKYYCCKIPVLLLCRYVLSAFCTMPKRASSHRETNRFSPPAKRTAFAAQLQQHLVCKENATLTCHAAINRMDVQSETRTKLAQNSEETFESIVIKHDLSDDSFALHAFGSSTAAQSTGKHEIGNETMPHELHRDSAENTHGHYIVKKKLTEFAAMSDTLSPVAAGSANNSSVGLDDSGIEISPFETLRKTPKVPGFMLMPRGRFPQPTFDSLPSVADKTELPGTQLSGSVCVVESVAEVSGSVMKDTSCLQENKAVYKGSMCSPPREDVQAHNPVFLSTEMESTQHQVTGTSLTGDKSFQGDFLSASQPGRITHCATLASSVVTVTSVSSASTSGHEDVKSADDNGSNSSRLPKSTGLRDNRKSRQQTDGPQKVKSAKVKGTSSVSAPDTIRSMSKQLKENPPSSLSSEMQKRGSKQTRLGASSGAESDKICSKFSESTAATTRSSGKQLKQSPPVASSAGRKQKAKQTVLPANVLNQIVTVVKENVRKISTEVITGGPLSLTNDTTTDLDNPSKVNDHVPHVSNTDSAKQGDTEESVASNPTSDVQMSEANKNSNKTQGLGNHQRQVADATGDGIANSNRSLEGILPLEVEEAIISVPSVSGKMKNKKKKAKPRKEAVLELEAERKELLGVLPQYVPENDMRMKKRKENKVYNLSALFSGDLGERQFQEAPKRPNYFAAIQITNQEIKDGIGEVLASVEKCNKKVKPAFIPLDLLHLTLAVMHLPDEEAVQKAKAALDDYKERHHPIMEESEGDDALTFDVSGISNFRNQVVFAQISEGPALKRLTRIAETIQLCLSEQDITAVDKNGFKPHITIMKMSKNPNQLRKGGVKKISEDLYKESKSRQFGLQTVATIQLCAMTKPKKDNYYHIEHEVALTVQEELVTVNQLPVTVSEVSLTAREAAVIKADSPASGKDVSSAVNEGAPGVIEIPITVQESGTVQEVPFSEKDV